MASSLFRVTRYDLGTDYDAAFSTREKDALERLHCLARKRAVERGNKNKAHGTAGGESLQVSAASKRSKGAAGKVAGSISEDIGRAIAHNSSETGKMEKEEEEEEEEKGEEEGEEEEEEEGEEGEDGSNDGSVDFAVSELFAVLGRDRLQPKGRGCVGVAAVPKWMEHPVPVSEDFAGQSMPLDQFPLPYTIMENLHKMGVRTFFPVQCAVVPHVLGCSAGLLLRPASGVRPRDLCVASPTGSGKTLAYVVPIVTILSRFCDHALRCIVVAPSQDLVEQVGGVFDQVGAGTGLRVFKASGKWPLRREREQLVESLCYGWGCVDVLVTTPGRLVDHLGLGLPLPLLRYLVVDEVDRLIDQSFQEWLDRVLAAVGPTQVGVLPGPAQLGVGLGPSQVGVGPGPAQVGARLAVTVVDEPSTLLRSMLQPLVGTSLYFGGNVLQPSGLVSSVGHAAGSGQETADSLLGDEVPLQKLLFSATLTQSPEKLALLKLYRPLLFLSSGATSDLSPTTVTWHSLPASLQEFGMVSSSQDKPLMVLHLLVNLKLRGMLCFARSRESVHRLCRLIKHFGGVACGEFSSNRTRGQRQECLEAFEAGRLDVLVCSDAMARGMDLGKVSARGGSGSKCEGSGSENEGSG